MNGRSPQFERPSSLRSKEANPLIYRLLSIWICPGMVTRQGPPRRNVTQFGRELRALFAVQHFPGRACDELWDLIEIALRNVLVPEPERSRRQGRGATFVSGGCVNLEVPDH
jgi:hypothetical protein